jgi:hypothetical protein
MLRRLRRGAYAIGVDPGGRDVPTLVVWDEARPLLTLREVYVIQYRYGPCPEPSQEIEARGPKDGIGPRIPID